MKVIDVRYYFMKGELFVGTELRKGFPEFLEIIEYTETFINGCKLEKVAMFNSTVVSANEVQSWIEQGILDIEAKSAVVVMTKKQYENLFDHVTFNNLEKPQKVLTAFMKICVLNNKEEYSNESNTKTVFCS